MKRKNKKNYKRLSGFDKSLIMGLIVESIKEKGNINREGIHNYLETNQSYIDLVKNLGFINSDILYLDSIEPEVFAIRGCFFILVLSNST